MTDYIIKNQALSYVSKIASEKVQREQAACAHIDATSQTSNTNLLHHLRYLLIASRPHRLLIRRQI